jgi:hypothetical protein
VISWKHTLASNRRLADKTSKLPKKGNEVKITVEDTNATGLTNLITYTGRVKETDGEKVSINDLDITHYVKATGKPYFHSAPNENQIMDFSLSKVADWEITDTDTSPDY